MRTHETVVQRKSEHSDASPPPSSQLRSPEPSAGHDLPFTLPAPSGSDFTGGQDYGRIAQVAQQTPHLICHDSAAAPMTAGLKPGAETAKDEEGFVGGRTFGEMLGDAGRVIGTGVGNVVGDVAAALTNIDITSTTNAGPTWQDHGAFEWVVGFNTTGQSGWIVQEVINTYRAQDAAGTDLGGAAPTPHYWEAWAVDDTSAITPSVGANHDYWLRPDRGDDTQGHWSMEGKVYFTTTDPATQGLAPGGVPDAGVLLSGTNAPADLGVARLHRYAQGTWDSTGVLPTHTGSAGP